MPIKRLGTKVNLGGSSGSSDILTDGTVVTIRVLAGNYEFSRYTIDGEVISKNVNLGNIGVGSFHGSPTITHLANGGFVVSANQSESGAGGVPQDFFVQTFDADGTSTSAATIGHTTTAGRQDEVHIIGTEDGGFFVGFNDYSNAGHVFFPLFNPDNGLISNSAAEAEDVRYRFFDAAGNGGVEINGNDVSRGSLNSPHTHSALAGSQIGGDVALLENGSVVWSAYDTYYILGAHNGPQPFGVIAAAIIAPGEDETEVIRTTVDTDDLSAANAYDISAARPDVVALSDGRYAIVWNRGLGGGAVDTMVRFYDEDGNPETSPIEILHRSSTQSPGVLEASGEVCALKDGGFAYAYSVAGAASTKAIKLNTYDSEGNLTGSTTVAPATFDQRVGELRLADDGSLILTWYKSNGDVFNSRFVVHDSTQVVTTGTAAGNNLTGGTGHDWFDGEGGGDVINGLAGKDHIYGGAGADSVSGGTGNDSVYGGSGGDTIAGNQNNDLLDGGAGADTINGGLGNDTITGGAGTDQLTGGGGNDVFRYTAISESELANRSDTITDFDAGSATTFVDRIDLRGIDADEGTAGLQSFHFIGSAAFTVGDAGAIRVYHQGGNTRIDANTDNGVATEFRIVIQGLLDLTKFDAGDFLS